jgi:hypothetical protein
MGIAVGHLTPNSSPSAFHRPTETKHCRRNSKGRCPYVEPFFHFCSPAPIVGARQAISNVAFAHRLSHGAGYDSWNVIQLAWVDHPWRATLAHRWTTAT